MEENMNSEEQLKQEYGNTLHFRVPENYFQNFNKEMMERIRKEEEGNAQVRKTAVVRRLRPLRWAAAACVAGVVLALGGRFIANNNDGMQQTAQPAPLASTATANQQDDIDKAIDFYMVNEYEAYDLLAEN